MPSLLALMAQIPPPPGQGLPLGPVTLNFYGLVIGIGAVLAVLLARRRYAALGGDPEDLEMTAIVGLIAGFLGARIGFVLWRLPDFADRPLAVFAIWEGGLVLFGGLVGGIAAAWFMARRRGMDIPAFADAAAPGIPLAQAIGRWGNYFNQELYGLPADVPWALEVEPDRRAAGFEEFSTFHPTFLYESLANLVLVAVILVVGRGGRLHRGALIFVYLAGYSVIRFSVELLRIDTDFRLLGLSRNNWAFALLAIAAIVALVWWQRRPEPQPAPKSGSGRGTGSKGGAKGGSKGGSQSAKQSSRSRSKGRSAGGSKGGGKRPRSQR
ncbi:prolipoprotein diacylglyceryl transferase [Egibacter rhizosphaerae]|uniref:Phosphatidylglycerol--prolipoprotein diacylglyceryl transferase n=1 Tax=Egibacter rhizosphaerae TaxID=1670831 RepID=A0A411YKV5_9ACTN|nr:prolipoprotein diacylglyceryl transferase [Egibacter rhizosphaerae]QBI21813.1 prolipoprotein diacylglyceryl transferase [Egibacter rhizosphaerae]